MRVADKINNDEFVFTRRQYDCRNASQIRESNYSFAFKFREIIKAFYIVRRSFNGDFNLINYNKVKRNCYLHLLPELEVQLEASKHSVVLDYSVVVALLLYYDLYVKQEINRNIFCCCTKCCVYSVFFCLRFSFSRSEMRNEKINLRYFFF